MIIFFTISSSGDAIFSFLGGRPGFFFLSFPFAILLLLRAERVSMINERRTTLDIRKLYHGYIELSRTISERRAIYKTQCSTLDTQRSALDTQRSTLAERRAMSIAGTN